VKPLKNGGIYEAVTYTAIFTKIVYTITYEMNGGVNHPDNPSTYTVESGLITLMNPTRSGYSFTGWTPSDNIPAGSTGNKTFTADWKLLPPPPPPPPPGPQPDPNPGTTPIPVVPPTPAPIEIKDEPKVAGPVFITDHVSYIIGYEDGTSRPERNVTRAEVATVFYRLLTKQMRRSNWTLENPFSDVASDAWYNAAISVISWMGVIKGYDDGTYRPDAHITRAELAAISARFAKAVAMRGSNEASFTDIADHWACDEILYAARIGWVSGYPDGTFKPDQSITRAEFITLVNRVLERIPEVIEDMLLDEMVEWSDNADMTAWYYIAVQEATNSHLYQFKEGQKVPGRQFEYEKWLAMKENPDWLQLERDWIATYTRK